MDQFQKSRTRTARIDPQMKIRLPKQIKDTIEQSAEHNGRSRAAEILIRLIESINVEPKKKNRDISK